MHIKEYKQLQFKSIGFYTIDLSIKKPLSFMYVFFHDAYFYIKRQGILNFLKEMDENKEEYEYVYEDVSLSTDWEKKLFYLHDTEFDYCKQAKTPELKKLLDELTPLKACQQNLIDYIVLSQENFNKIIINWDKYCKSKHVNPFILLYQDDKDWFDVLPFESRESMEQFLVNHTKLK